MRPSVQRVLVVGPGALGVIIATRLAAAGHQVIVAARDPASAKHLPEKWIAVAENGARVEANMRIIGRVAELRNPVDVLIIATKCSSAAHALRQWLPKLRSNGAAICLQNGMLGDELAAIAGDRLVECTVAFPATLLSPGISEQTGPGAFIIGAWPDARMDQASPVELAAKTLADVETTRVSDNMRGVKWTKLIINSAISGLGALTGENLGTIFADKRGRLAAIEIATEGYRAGLDHGVDFESIAGFHPARIALDKAQRRKLPSRHLILQFMARRYRRQRSSSLQSLERGRHTEIAYLNARLVQESRYADRAAPVNEQIVDLVAEIEVGHLRPSMDNLALLETRFHRRGRPLQKKPKRG